MDNAPAFIAVGTVLAATYLFMQSQATAGTGQGAITTDSGEGAGITLDGIVTQVTNAATSAPSANPTNLSGQGLAALQRREGFSATPYADHKGYSIGYGHLIKPGENLTHVSVQEALDILASDVAWAETAVVQNITVDLDQAQFDALTSFCFNVGAGAFARSTLVKRINAGDPGATDEFSRWVFASGQRNSALVARRQSEQSQFEGQQA